jgi:hypothetical protein
MLVTRSALVVVAGGVTGTVRALAGGPAVTSADENLPGDVLKAGQEIADTRRNAVEQAMEKLPSPNAAPPVTASVMSLETYPLSVAPDINVSRVQRVANEMYHFGMLERPFQVSSMLGGL